MKVRRIVIEQILGIEHLEIKPGNLCVISGRNGSGKTSCLEALKNVLSGGHDPSLIRSGSSSGMVSIELADGVAITKKIFPEKSVLTVKHPTYGKISKSQAWLDSIVDSLSLDPVAFLTASSKDRVKILLQALPMKVTCDQLVEIGIGAAGLDLDRHALRVLDDIRSELYEKRRDVNAAAKDKRATVRQMAETLPQEAPDGAQDWNETLKAAGLENAELLAATKEKVAQIRGKASGATQKAKADYEMHKEKIGSLRDRKIEELRAEFERQAQKVRDDCTAALEKWQHERDANISAAEFARDEQLASEDAAYRPKKAAIDERMARARAMAEQQAKAEKTREFIGSLTDQAELLEAESDVLTGNLQALEQLKADLLKELPIPGLEIRDGELYIDGISFDTVNTARQYEIAIKVGQLKAGELGLLLVDRGEVLDDKSFAAFREAAAASGCQVMIARVSNEEQLEVRSEEVPA